MHAFQVSLIGSVINEIKDPTIVDIGDSSGTHLQYVRELFLKGKKSRCLSINLDKEAVEKIKSKGMEAIHERAENLFKHNIRADVFLCFQMIEHLMNPCTFLHDLSEKTDAKYLIVTVPYMKTSRMGLNFIRENKKEKEGAETTHIFELSPEDWKLLFQFSGWRVHHEKIYYQYPKNHLLYFTKNLWRKHDFEGFYGVVLTRDNSISSQYLDW
jgi:2-polyprenyl-3-methyl-5-hydroxy-6-metoxy-1,4-benzoquinol methylase